MKHKFGNHQHADACKPRGTNEITQAEGSERQLLGNGPEQVRRSSGLRRQETEVWPEAGRNPGAPSVLEARPERTSREW